MESTVKNWIKDGMSLHTIRDWLHNYRAALLIFIITLFVTFPYKLAYETEMPSAVGQVSQATVIAPFRFDVHRSHEELDIARQRVESQSLPVFNHVDSSYTDIKSDITHITALLTALGDTLLSDTLNQEYRLELSQYFSMQDYEAIVKSIRVLPAINKVILSSARQGILSDMIVETDQERQQVLVEYQERVRVLVSESRFVLIKNGESEHAVSLDSLYAIPQVYSAVLAVLPTDMLNRRRLSSAFFHYTKAVLKPTSVYDKNETQYRLKSEVAKIKTVKQTVVKDVEIVRKHQIVTPEIDEVLTALYEEQQQRSSEKGVSKMVTGLFVAILLILFVAIVLTLYLVNYTPPRLIKRDFFRAFAVIVSLQLIIIRVSQWLVVTSAETQISNMVSSHNLAYGAIPLVVAPLLASILFNRQSGLFMAIFFSVYIGIITDYNLINSIGALVTGAFAAYIANTIRYRKDFLWLVVWLIGINAASDLLAVVGGYGWASVEIKLVVLYAIVDALLSVLIVMLLLPVIESVFKLTTNMRLLELADMNHPLLKELVIKAPGTYNHSIMVANLAEAAATAIGADALLCRVASYYHDIGKSKKPQSFIENQRLKKNVHDKWSAIRSARAISGHVSDGLIMADKYHLPPAIRDAIQQHHGDALISFFYQKALEEQKDNEVVDERDYHYGGPKPQSKEMAIIMIADSVEAVSRTLKSATVKELREITVKIGRDKILKGQLDECTLTFKDLNGIANGMLTVLGGAFHSRIEYPDAPEEEQTTLDVVMREDVRSEDENAKK